MLANKTLRIVEAFHILVFMAFSVWIPFCFEAMPGAGSRLMENEDNLRLNAKHAEVTHQGVDLLVGEERVAFTGSLPEECKHSNRLTVVPFLIALIGGGVFSLEAFEAFPML
mmetsp:Transcript_76354/g.210809  ORF Transcript_76354/g.210809 Transcript_76354/m.210809 type:complete len:112 (+) Transcript_76354:67-402(+)